MASQLLHHPPPPSAAFFSSSHHFPHRLNPNPSHYPPLQQNPSIPTLHPHNLARSFIHLKPISLNQILTTSLNNQNPKVNFLETPKFFSTATPPPPPPPDPEHTYDPNDPRQVVEKMMKHTSRVSKGLVVLGLVRLGLVAWCSYTVTGSPIPHVSLHTFSGLMMPFSVAYVMRASLKPMSFLWKLGKMGGAGGC